MRLRLKSPASRVFTQPFIQAQIKENTKAPRHWPLCGEFTGDRRIPAQMASIAENVSIGRHHHDLQHCSFEYIGVTIRLQIIPQVLANTTHGTPAIHINSMVPESSRYDFENAIFHLGSLLCIFRSSNDSAVRWMSRDLTDVKSTSV